MDHLPGAEANAGRRGGSAEDACGRGPRRHDGPSAGAQEQKKIGRGRPPPQNNRVGWSARRSERRSPLEAGREIRDAVVAEGSVQGLPGLRGRAGAARRDWERDGGDCALDGAQSRTADGACWGWDARPEWSRIRTAVRPRRRGLGVASCPSSSLLSVPSSAS